MAVGTITGGGRAGQTPLQRFHGASAANTALTTSTNTAGQRRLVAVYVAYSAAPTQAGVTVTLNSGIAAAYDTLLTSGSANAQYTAYIPDGDVWIMEGDAIDVLAPAGGGVITSAIQIVVETA